MKNAIAKQPQINQELTVLIDEDLHQEQELLKALIEEILLANEKIKKAHFERVEDTEAKLKVLNAEIQRIRKTIRAQDDTVAEKRLKLLEETKEDYFEALSELRLKDVKSHFSEPLRNHLKNISHKVESLMGASAASRSLNQAILSYYQGLEKELDEDALMTFENSEQQSQVFESFRNVTIPLLDSFKGVLNPIIESIKTHLKNHLDLQDYSEVEELFEDIDDVKNQDLKEFNDQKSALNEALKTDLDVLDKQFDDELAHRLESKLGTSKDDLLTSDITAQIESLDQLQDEIHSAMVSGSNAIELKRAYEKNLNNLYKTDYGKVLKSVHKSLNKESKTLLEEKKQKRKEHLEQLYEVMLQEKERSIQAFIDVFSLKLRTMIDKTSDLEPLFESFYKDLKTYFESVYNLIKAQLELSQTMLSVSYDSETFIQKIVEQKIAFTERYDLLVKSLKIKTLDALEERHIEFEKIRVQLDEQLEKERLELKRIYGLDKILDHRLRTISKSKIARLNEVEALRYQMYQDESDIALAEKEYDIQVLKAQSLYDHERAINKVQTERVDAGVRVNKAMVQATVKRQVNFADQQIKFAEAEYAARLEHIEYTLNQELSYTEDTLGYHYQSFEKRRQEMELEYLSKKHSNDQKKKLFKHSDMLNKVLNEEKEIDADYERKVEAFEQERANNIQIKRYLDQIQKANEHAENARKDALELKDKDITSFEALRQESLDRLANIESMMTQPDLLPYHEEAVNDQASVRLQEMLNSAETFLNEKINVPKKRLEETKERLLELEKQTVSSEDIEKLTSQEVALNESFEAALKTLEANTLDKLSKIDLKQAARLKESKDILESIESLLATKVAFNEARLQTEQKRLEANLKSSIDLINEQLLQAKITKDEFLTRIDRTLNKAIERLIDHRVKTQMVLEKVEHRQSSTVKDVYDDLKKAFQKDVKKIK